MLEFFSPFFPPFSQVKTPLVYERESDGAKITVPAGDILISSPPISHRLPTVFTNPSQVNASIHSTFFSLIRIFILNH